MDKINNLLNILIPSTDLQPSGGSVFERRDIIPECELELDYLFQWANEVLIDSDLTSASAADVTKLLRTDNLKNWRKLLLLISEVYCGDRLVFELLYGSSEALNKQNLEVIDFDLHELVEPVRVCGKTYR